MRTKFDPQNPCKKIKAECDVGSYSPSTEKVETEGSLATRLAYLNPGHGETLPQKGG